MSERLPSGWKQDRLDAVAELERATVLPQDIREGTKYVGLEHIDSSGAFLDVPEVEQGEIASNKFAFSEQHVLYGKLRPYLTKIARPDFAGVCSTEIIPIRANGRLIRDYLYFYLRQPRMVALANARTAGANLPRLSPIDLASFPITYPESTTEQRRIANILDDADALRRKRAAAIQLANDLVPSLFYKMFGDPVTNSNRWRVGPLSELADITTGNTPATANAAYYGNEIEWIKSDNLETPLHIASTAKVYLSQRGKEVARVVGPGCTLVTCIAGSLSSIGNASMVDREVAFNQQINALTPKPGVDSRFLYVLVRMMRGAIQSLATAALKNIVNKGNLEGLRAINPPSDMQQQFGIRFEEALKVLRRQHESDVSLSNLFHSLLQRAFRGEL